MATKKVLFITGVSSGFGRALAKRALSEGHRVVGTVRSLEAKETFELSHVGHAFGCILDVTDFDAIPAVIAEVEASVARSMCS